MNQPEELDPVRLAIARKLKAKVMRKVREITHEDCQCRENLIRTIGVLVDLGMDVFNGRPEYHAAIMLLAAASRQGAMEWEKTQTGDVIYL